MEQHQGQEPEQGQGQDRPHNIIDNVANPMEEYRRELDRQDEAKHDAATIMAEKFCNILGVEGDEERAKMVEGYRAVFAGGPRFPVGLSPTPKMVTPPDPICTTEEANGDLVTYDWYCLLSRLYKQVVHKDGTCSIYCYGKQLPIKLTNEQTRSMLRYVQQLSDVPAGAYFGPQPTRVPVTLLAHPLVKSIIE